MERSQRAATIGWTLLLALPATLTLVWLFSNASLQTYADTFLAPNPETPLALRVPLLALAVAALSVLLMRHALRHVSMLRLAFAAVPLLIVLKITLLGTGILYSLALLLPGIAILLAGLGLGLRLLRWLGFNDGDFFSSSEEIALAAPLGLGVLALLLFGAGSFGLLQSWLWRVAVIAAILQAYPLLQVLRGRMAADAHELRANSDPFAQAALIFAALWFVAHTPLLWSPPLDYDVLEYHLAAPAQYLRDGRISFLTENIYATFPAVGEMFYLLAMLLNGSKLNGLPAAHLIILGFWGIAALGVYALSLRTLRRDKMSTPGPAAVATVLFLLLPLGTHLYSDFYVEHFQTAFHLTALLSATIYLGTGNNRALILAGLLAGLACGTKYTALLLTLVPLIVLVPVFTLLEHNLIAASRALVLILLPALSMFAPWLLRNGLASGDPLYPLGLVTLRRLTGDGAIMGTADRIDHFDIAHRAGQMSFKAFGRALGQIFSRLGETPAWLTNIECGPFLLGFVPVLLAGLRRKTVAFIFCVFLFDLLLWFLLTHRLNRFFFCVLPLLPVLIAAGLSVLWQHKIPRLTAAAVTAAFVILFAPLSMVMVWKYSRPEIIAGIESTGAGARAHYHSHGNGGWYDAWSQINGLPPGTRTLFIGDAQTFYLEQTPAYSVVFNPSALEDALLESATVDELKSALQKRGISHIYINYSEWLRLDTTYAIAQPGNRWVRAQFTKKAHEDLARALSAGDIANYFRVWPPKVAHAYLKVEPPAAVLFQQFLNEETTVEHQHKRNNATVLELRAIK